MTLVFIINLIIANEERKIQITYMKLQLNINLAAGYRNREE